MSHLLLPIPFQPLLQREYADILQQQFNKRFSFSPTRLPELEKGGQVEVFTAEYWRDERLQAMKNRLNTTKSSLNNLPLGRWHKHTRKLNPAGAVTNQLRKSANPELLTQAWQKFHECFQVFRLGPGPGQLQYKSVHLCEAPGAFVTSLNQALVLHHPGTTWSWLATTLNPHYEGNDLGYMINDDRFIMGSLDHWEFGEDNTGDLMNRANLEQLVAAAGQLGGAGEGEAGKVDLVTADGSIDCQSDPARQESIVSDLHHCEAVAALRILAPGGSLVLKMFTLFESESVCLLYLLVSVFNEVDVFKPATSKEGNSEVYIVCRDLQPSNWLESVLAQLSGPHYGKFPVNNSLFGRAELPDSFMAEVMKCGELFMQLQENVINNNLHYWQDPLNGADMKDLAEIQKQVAERYMKLYRVEEMPSYRYCVYRRKDPNVSQMDARTDRGTFTEKMAEYNLEPKSRLLNIRAALQSWKVKGRVRFVEWVPAPRLGSSLPAPVTGRRLEQVLSSKFCTGLHLQFFSETAKLLADMETEESQAPSKKRKVDKSQKAYQGKIKNLKEYNEDVRILRKLSAIFPDIVDKSKVMFLSSAADSNMLVEECKPDNQIRLIGTIIEAVTALEAGQHLLVQGFPLHTRLTTAIFYCLAALFEEVGFVKPTGQDDFIFLSNFLGSSNTAEESISSLESILTVLYNHKGPDQVLSAWSVTDLVQDRIYQEIILFNQTRIKERILSATDFLQPTETSESK